MGLGSAARQKIINGAKTADRVLRKEALVKSVPKTVLNPLGKKTTKRGAGLIVGGVAIWGIGTGGIVEGRAKTLADNAEYVGNVGAMDYDAVPNVDRMTGQRNFGATGDLVFGLSKSRQG